MMFTPDPPSLPPEIAAAFREAFMRGIHSPADPEEVAATTIDRYNNTPRADLGGLSPRQAWELLATDWETPDGPLSLNPSLTFEELGGADLFHNARTVLGALRDEGPMGVTPKGYLNRRAVGSLLDRLRWEPDFLETVSRMNKVIDELDVTPLYLLREALLDLRLIRRSKGLHISPLGRRMLAPDQSGELFRQLFLSRVTRPLLYVDRGTEPGALVVTLPFACWQLTRKAKDWTQARRLSESVWPSSAAADAAGAAAFDSDNALFWLTHSILLRPLTELGLLERRSPGTGWEARINQEFRVTALFGRFFRFEL